MLFHRQELIFKKTLFSFLLWIVDYMYVRGTVDCVVGYFELCGCIKKKILQSLSIGNNILIGACNEWKRRKRILTDTQ